MTTAADLQALVEAHLARGGKVTRVEAGARTLTEREVWLARRDDNARIVERHVAGTDHLGRQHVVNGLGETIGWA